MPVWANAMLVGYDRGQHQLNHRAMNDSLDEAKWGVDPLEAVPSPAACSFSKLTASGLGRPVKTALPIEPSQLLEPFSMPIERATRDGRAQRPQGAEIIVAQLENGMID